MLTSHVISVGPPKGVMQLTKCSQTVNIEVFETDVQGREDEESVRCYKPLKYHMEDVLDEMKKLEEQDTGTPVYCDEKLREDVPQFSQGDVATESFEADAYLETEGLLLNADVECMQMVEENEQTSDNLEKDLIITDQKYTEKQSSSVKTFSNPDTKQLGEMGKDLTSETDMDNNIKASGASVAEFVVINKPTEIKKASPNALVEYGTLESSEKIETEVSNIIEEDLSSCTAEKFNCCGVTDKSLKASGNIQNNQESLSWNKGAVRNENSNARSNIFDNLANNAELVVKNDQLEGSAAVVLEQLQVPEISSGKNKVTQTDVTWSLKKSFVDESTSPFQDLKLTDVGVQCDLGTFPTLADLAGKSFSFRSVRNAESLHENTETYGIPPTKEESMDQTKISTAYT